MQRCSPDPRRQSFVDTGIAPPSPVSFDDVQSIETHAPAADGTMIPLSIIALRAGVRGDRHAVLMYAYGAYGATIGPTFPAMRRAWLDRGGIWVVLHVCGSGGFGDEGTGRSVGEEPNSVNDLIDAADPPLPTGWASPATLSAVGVSAGGIVIGGAIVARPELFSGAIINVGLVNPLRIHRSRLARSIRGKSLA